MRVLLDHAEGLHANDQPPSRFTLAGADRVWHPARMKIDGYKVVVTSPGVKKPRGVSYGTGGIGFQPNLYNRALLPTTPFIYFDNKLVTSETWPDEKLKVAGAIEVELDALVKPFKETLQGL